MTKSGYYLRGSDGRKERCEPGKNYPSHFLKYSDIFLDKDQIESLLTDNGRFRITSAIVTENIGNEIEHVSCTVEWV